MLKYLIFRGTYLSSFLRNDVSEVDFKISGDGRLGEVDTGIDETRFAIR